MVYVASALQCLECSERAPCTMRTESDLSIEWAKACSLRYSKDESGTVEVFSELKEWLLMISRSDQGEMSY